MHVLRINCVYIFARVSVLFFFPSYVCVYVLKPFAFQLVLFDLFSIKVSLRTFYESVNVGIVFSSLLIYFCVNLVF